MVILNNLFLDCHTTHPAVGELIQTAGRTHFLSIFKDEATVNLLATDAIGYALLFR